MADDGIVGNDYTGYTVPLLSERNAFYDNFVQNALANVDDEKSYAAQAAKLQVNHPPCAVLVSRVSLFWW